VSKEAALPDITVRQGFLELFDGFAFRFAPGGVVGFVGGLLVEAQAEVVFFAGF